tara:strand:- start:4930 stop:5358 length:429 start_codon:yes stop_codon:yes gene_type:complete
MPDIIMRGPLFTKRKKIVRDVTKAFIQRVVEQGEQRLDEMLRPRPAGVYLSIQESDARGNLRQTGNYARNIVGDVNDSPLEGVIHDSDVVYGPWLEGTSTRNQSTQFKGYASFRKTKDWMDKQVKIMRKEFERRYAKKLNGI